MSILIKGIEKPEYGFIEIRLYDNRAECEVQEHVYTDLEIKEVPEPHGRLIDADELCKGLMSRWDTADEQEQKIISYIMASIVTPIVVGTPTVIEAEDQKHE